MVKLGRSTIGDNARNSRTVAKMTENLREDFRRDGVVKLTGALSRDDLAAARDCYDWSLAHLGPHGKGGDWLPSDGQTFEDKANPDAPARYETFLRASPLADIARDVWRCDDVWFMYEQVFRKAGACRRTPWHQDSSYLAVSGTHLAVFWISFAAVPKAEALEFARGSHLGPTYNGSTFNLADPAETIYPAGTLPPLPGIDAARQEWDIVSWAVEPGDALLFHPNMLHGGAATEGTLRETLSLRFFGTDATYAKRPGPCGPRIAGLHDALSDGDPLRHPAFLRLR